MAEQAPIEFELKFSCRASERTKVLRSAWLKSHAAGKQAKKRNLSIYFDTPDRRLARKGVVLRVREKGGKFEQTVKADGGASPLARLEATVPLSTAEPDPSQLGPPSLRRRIGLILPSELAPLYTTDIDRTTVPLKLDHDGRETLVEAAFDGGKVTAKGAAENISEIELEHVSGDASGVYRLGLSLMDAAAVGLETRTKSHRGRHLRYGEKAEAVYAGVIPMKVTDTASNAFANVGASCINLILANQAAVLDREDIEGVHQMRVGLRRLKSLFAIFGNMLPAYEVTRFKSRIGSLNDVLGNARDLDVLLTETIAQVRSGRPEDDALDVLQSISLTAQTQAYDAACRLLSGKRFARFVLSSALYFADRSWETDRNEADWQVAIGSLAAPFLDKRRKAVLKRGRGFEGLDIPSRHAVRITLKKLRYAVDFFAPLYDQNTVKPYLKRLKSLQTDLGALNDVAVAEIVLDRLNAAHRSAPEFPALEAARGLVVGWFGHRVAAGEDHLTSSWKDFEDAVPFWKNGA